MKRKVTLEDNSGRYNTGITSHGTTMFRYGKLVLCYTLEHALF